MSTSISPTLEELISSNDFKFITEEMKRTTAMIINFFESRSYIVDIEISEDDIFPDESSLNHISLNVYQRIDGLLDYNLGICIRDYDIAIQFHHESLTGFIIHAPHIAIHSPHNGYHFDLNSFLTEILKFDSSTSNFVKMT